MAGRGCESIHTVSIGQFLVGMTSTDAASDLLHEDATSETVPRVRASIQGFVQTDQVRVVALLLRGVQVSRDTQIARGQESERMAESTREVAQGTKRIATRPEIEQRLRAAVAMRDARRVEYDQLARAAEAERVAGRAVAFGWRRGTATEGWVSAAGIERIIGRVRFEQLVWTSIAEACAAADEA